MEDFDWTFRVIPSGADDVRLIKTLQEMNDSDKMYYFGITLNSFNPENW